MARLPSALPQEAPGWPVDLNRVTHELSLNTRASTRLIYMTLAEALREVGHPCDVLCSHLKAEVFLAGKSTVIMESAYALHSEGHLWTLSGHTDWQGEMCYLARVFLERTETGDLPTIEFSYPVVPVGIPVYANPYQGKPVHLVQAAVKLMRSLLGASAGPSSTPSPAPIPCRPSPTLTAAEALRWMENPGEALPAAGLPLAGSVADWKGVLERRWTLSPLLEAALGVWLANPKAAEGPLGSQSLFLWLGQEPQSVLRQRFLDAGLPVAPDTSPRELSGSRRRL